MTAEAPSAVSTGESPQSVVDATTPRRPLRATPGGPDEGSDGATAPDGTFSYLQNGNGVHADEVPPNGAEPSADEPGPIEDRTETAEPDTAETGEAAEVAEAEVAEAEVAEAEVPETAEVETAEADAAEPQVFEPDLAEPDLADADLADADLADADLADAAPAQPAPAEFDAIESDAPEPDVLVGAVSVDAVSVDAVVVEPVEVVDTVDGEPAPSGELLDEPQAESISNEAVAAEVAEQLGSVLEEDDQPDPAEFAAAAVLDVLRASGWADAAEAAELQAEATRLRELLAEVIRDHRAREATAAGGQNQQLSWLVPLLRAAHGVAFGSLGAKVALRTAVQEVPPDVLALAGLRIDYGVEPAYDEQ